MSDALNYLKSHTNFQNCITGWENVALNSIHTECSPYAPQFYPILSVIIYILLFTFLKKIWSYHLCYLSAKKKRNKWLMYFKVCPFKSNALYFSLKKNCREKTKPVSLHICRRNFISMASIQSHADKGSPLPHKIVIFIMHTVKLLKAKSSKFSNSTSIWNKMMWNTVMVAMDLKIEKKHFLYILGPMLCIQVIFFFWQFWTAYLS